MSLGHRTFSPPHNLTESRHLRAPSLTKHHALMTVYIYPPPDVSYTCATEILLSRKPCEGSWVELALLSTCICHTCVSEHTCIFMCSVEAPLSYTPPPLSSAGCLPTPPAPSLVLESHTNRQSHWKGASALPVVPANSITQHRDYQGPWLLVLSAGSSSAPASVLQKLRWEGEERKQAQRVQGLPQEAAPLQSWLGLEGGCHYWLLLVLWPWRSPKVGW
jgi:hypothetical protein